MKRKNSAERWKDQQRNTNLDKYTNEEVDKDGTDRQ